MDPRVMKFEELRETLRRWEMGLHPLNGEHADLEGLEQVVSLLPVVVEGRERLRVRWAAGTGGVDAPLREGVTVDVARLTVPPISKPGQRNGWEPSEVRARRKAGDVALDALGGEG